MSENIFLFGVSSEVLLAKSKTVNQWIGFSFKYINADTSCGRHSTDLHPYWLMASLPRN